MRQTKGVQQTWRLFRRRAGTSISRQVAQQRRGTADCGIAKLPELLKKALQCFTAIRTVLCLKNARFGPTSYIAVADVAGNKA
jgi:hypothetical protein